MAIEQIMELWKLKDCDTHPEPSGCSVGEGMGAECNLAFAVSTCIHLYLSAAMLEH